MRRSVMAGVNKIGGLRSLSLGLLLAACTDVGKVAFSDPQDPSLDTEDVGETDDLSDTDVPVDSDGGVPSVDDDNDGYASDEDCDDSNGAINPGAEEVGNGLDDDCSGYADDVAVCSGAGDFEQIQEAVDATPDGWTLVVCPGIYREHLQLAQRELWVVSTAGATATVIEAPGPGTVIRASAGAEILLRGFTVRGGLGEDGGGVRCLDASMALVGNVIEGNRANRDGGGVSAARCEVHVEGNQIQDNIAARSGGGVHLDESPGEVIDNLVADNEAYDGGGIFVSTGGGPWGSGADPSRLVNNEIRGNLCTTIDEESWGGHGGGGGGIFYDGQAHIEGNLVYLNESMYNGGAVFLHEGDGEVFDNHIMGNVSHEDGGGLYANWGEYVIEDNLFEGNEALDDAGGLRLYHGESEVTGNTLVGNIAADDAGGMKASHGFDHQISQNLFEGNTAGDVGGGLELDNDTSWVHDNTYVENSAARGGAVHHWRNERDLEMADNVYERNTASDCGGALAFDNMSTDNRYWATMWREVFNDNVANDGGAICTDIVFRDPEDVDGVEEFYEPSKVRVFNSLIFDGDADDDGGAIYAKAGIVELTNNVLENNDAPTGAAVVAKQESEIVLINNIIVRSGGGAVAVSESGGVITMSYNDFWDNDGGFDGVDSPIGRRGNVSVDPQFDQDFRLLGTSPCRNAGAPFISDVNGSRSDMGAYGGPESP